MGSAILHLLRSLSGETYLAVSWIKYMSSIVKVYLASAKISSDQLSIFYRLLTVYLLKTSMNKNPTMQDIFRYFIGTLYCFLKIVSAWFLYSASETTAPPLPIYIYIYISVTLYCFMCVRWSMYIVTYLSLLTASLQFPKWSVYVTNFFMWCHFYSHITPKASEIT